jgi:hypothetical protein
VPRQLSFFLCSSFPLHFWCFSFPVSLFIFPLLLLLPPSSSHFPYASLPGSLTFPENQSLPTLSPI